MIFKWVDYNPDKMRFVEKWLDKKAVKMTGMDDGFCDFYEYWAKEEGFMVGKNYWCKVVFEDEKPFAVTALSMYEGVIYIMEVLVAPKMRGKGKGSKMIKELLNNGKEIIGLDIQKAEATIYPSNEASQKAFSKAGFKHEIQFFSLTYRQRFVCRVLRTV